MPCALFLVYADLLTGCTEGLFELFLVSSDRTEGFLNVHFYINELCRLFYTNVCIYDTYVYVKGM